MTSYARVGRTAGIALGAVAGIAGLGAIAALRRPLPRTSGTLRLPGLSNSVQVLRDHWGVPHIYAATNVDLFMAQGYVHAQDRLWQMEFHRRIGHGQLAEIFGPVALPADRFLRILGFSRVARREADLLSEETARAIEAYTNGINAYIEQHIKRLPLEFSILRLQPRPWVPADVQVWGKVMALNLSENWTFEILRAHIIAAVGAERAAILDPRYPDEHPLTIPDDVGYSSNVGADALRLAAASAPFINGTNTGQGSNAWVVGGQRTTTGKPLLANDPHLAIQMPSIWYENHLIGGDYHVTGASFPGSPGVIIGHNEWITWGVTNGMTDVQDLYIERFDPNDPTRYEFRGAWEQAEIVREEINVRGRSNPVIEEVRITRHGPVISSLVDTQRGDKQQSNGTASASSSETLALRWTALDPGHITKSILSINRARDWDTFRSAIRDWDVPAQNFVYADVKGHVGYALSGVHPIRAKGDGRLPVPGWTGEYEWTGVIPHAELPHAYDPAEDVIVTANNRIVGDKYPYPLYGEWSSGYRATRIRQLIEQTSKHNAESFAGIHRDVRSLPGLELAELAGRLTVTTITAQHARDALASWDGELTAESIGGTIYARLRSNLLMVAYTEIAEPLGIVTGLGPFASLPGTGYLERMVTPLVFHRAATREDSWLPHGQTWDSVLQKAWEATITELRAEYGDDVRDWHYGRTHTATIRHPLSEVPALAGLLNRGPFPTGGDIDTVCMGYLPRVFATVPYYVAPSYRQICDTADWDRSQSVHATGQSGQPASRHYADFVKPWLNGHYHPMLWSRARVEEAAVKRMQLLP